MLWAPQASVQQCHLLHENPIFVFDRLKSVRLVQTCRHTPLTCQIGRPLLHAELFANRLLQLMGQISWFT